MSVRFKSSILFAPLYGSRVDAIALNGVRSCFGVFLFSVIFVGMLQHPRVSNASLSFLNVR